MFLEVRGCAGAVEARVRRVGRLSPITHNRPSGTLTGPNLVAQAGELRGIGRHRLRVQVRLGQPLAVDGQPGADPALHRLSTHRDHPLDRSFSSGGMRLTNDSVFWIARMTGLSDRFDL